MLFRQRYEQDLRLLKTPRAWVGALLAALFFASLPILPGFKAYLYDITFFVVFAIVAVALAILIGYTGQISLGHAGFLAAGAYATGYLHQLGVPYLLALVLAGALSGLLGLLIGLPALRLEGPYLAIATLGFGLAIQQILNNWDLLGASAGYPIDRPAYVGFEDAPFYYLVLIVAATIIWMSFNLERSHIGRAFMAVRDAEHAAQMSGINLSYFKTLAFVISAVFTGVAGGLYGSLLFYVSPQNFDLFLSIEFLLMVVIGGLGSLPGAILGAGFVVGLEIFLARAQNLSQLLFGLVVVGLMVLEPNGLYGRWLKVRDYWKRWPM